MGVQTPTWGGVGTWSRWRRKVYADRGQKSAICPIPGRTVTRSLRLYHLEKPYISAPMKSGRTEGKLSPA